MKRTTYILIGMLIAGFVVISGAIFYMSSLGTTWEDSFMEIGGEQKTVQLPECRVVQLSINVDNDESERSIVFQDAPLLVQPTDGVTGSFTCASDMASRLSMQTSGDTLNIVFDFSNDGQNEEFKDARWLKVRTAGMKLNIPETVQGVSATVYDMETTFKGFSRDTLSFSTNGATTVEDCRIASLNAHAGDLNFFSGEVRDLYLDLDGIHNWNVATEFFRIDTEHLSGSYDHYNTLQKGECRQVLWTPKQKDATLNLKLVEATKIEIEK
ncbi:hypothetical protein [Bacteroides sp.]|uniref:hypothetical protein n=1 Tax=Bacteroides sp. TaxID=29523 RepID=UPI003AB5ED6C